MIILFLVGSLIGSVFNSFAEILPKENRQILFQDVNFLGNPKTDNPTCVSEDSKYTNATWCGECYSQGSSREYSFESLTWFFLFFKFYKKSCRPLDIVKVFKCQCMKLIKTVTQMD